MTSWYRTIRGDLALRAVGLGACALSYIAFRQMLALHHAGPAHWNPGPIAYLLIAIGFVGGSAGSVLIVLGGHLLDRVEISERWRTRTDPD